jgi:hypothetical protein
MKFEAKIPGFWVTVYTVPLLLLLLLPQVPLALFEGVRIPSLHMPA